MILTEKLQLDLKEMAIIASIAASVIYFWPWIFLVILLILTFTLFKKNKSTNKTDSLDGLPEISPHWFWGNMDYSKHFNEVFEEHYRRMKGLRYCLLYMGANERKLFILDPLIVNKVMNTDFDHFMDTPFLPQQYTKVSSSVLLPDIFTRMATGFKKLDT